MRLFFLSLLFVFVVLSNRYGLQGVGVGVLEGEEGSGSKGRVSGEWKPTSVIFFLVTQELQQSTGFI